MIIFTCNSANGHMRVLGSLPANTHKSVIEQRAEREALAIGEDRGSIKVWQQIGEVKAVSAVKWESKT